MSKFSPMRFDVEKFDGRINFGLWQIQVKDVLIQSGLHKALRGKPIPISVSAGDSGDDSSKTSMISDEEWDDMDHLSILNGIVSELEAIGVVKELQEESNMLEVQGMLGKTRCPVGAGSANCSNKAADKVLTVNEEFY